MISNYSVILCNQRKRQGDKFSTEAKWSAGYVTNDLSKQLTQEIFLLVKYKEKGVRKEISNESLNVERGQVAKFILLRK